MKQHFLNIFFRSRWFSLIMFIVLGTMSVLAQKTVTGQINDNNGEPLIGVSIAVQGTATGTISDINGNYSIKLPEDKNVLLFSYMGYSPKEVKVGNQSVLNVILEEKNTELDEIVVVGYGTQKKANLTGAVSTLKGNDAITRNAVSLSSALAGTMPGVTVQQQSGEPGADGANIKIRGIGSLNSSTTPLVLVDGLEMSIDQVDPSSVESITTLKDAASASIYGSRAANGVILITTKKGKDGPLQISYRGTVSAQRPTNLPDPVSVIDFMEYSNLAASNIKATQIYSDELINDYKYFYADSWDRFDTDWKNEILKKQSFLTEHTINISGGSKTLQYFGVGSYVKQDGLIQNNSYERFSLRMNVDAQLHKMLKLTVASNMVNGKTIKPVVNTPKSIINKALSFPRVLPGINADGTWGGGRNGDNPIASARVGGISTGKKPEVSLMAQLAFQPIKELEILGKYSRRNVTTRTKSFARQWKYYDKGNLGGVVPLSYDNNQLTEAWEETVRNQYLIQATFDKTFLEAHQVKILGGFQAEDNAYSAFNVTRQNFEFPGYEEMSNGIGEPTAKGTANDWAMVSAFSRFNYVYKDKYLLELNGRWDASSRFRKEHRWKLFPSASVGWVFTQEEFLKSNPTLSFGKLRASYGILGNQNLPDNYPGWATVDPGYSYWFNKELNPGVAITTDSNPDITWEKSTQLDIGLDLMFLNNSLSFTGDFYVKKITDMLMKFPPPYFNGLKESYTNAASMRNTGWEIAITYRNNIKDVNYSVSLVLDDNRNKVLDLKGRTYQDKSIVVGYPYGGHWGYRTDGYFQTMNDILESPYFATSTPDLGYVKYVDQDDNDIIDANDMVYLGDAFPHYNYGVKLNASWNGFDALVFIQGVGQRSTYLSGIGLVPFSNGSTLFSHQADFWTPENRNATYPVLLPAANSNLNFQKSDKWVKNGAYGRLKTVELGYTLPVSVSKKMQISSFRLFVSGQNLLTISDFYKGYDPEVSVGGDQGGEFYPVMKLFTFGVDIKF